MPVFKSKQVSEALFGDLWTKMIKETEFGSKLKEEDMSILFVVHEPEFTMHVDENGPRFGEAAQAKTATVTMAMSGDTVHKYWMEQLNITKALASRQIKAKGPVDKVLQILPLMELGQKLYPDCCKKFGIQTE
jgi:putative sterol carrier protein